MSNILQSIVLVCIGIAVIGGPLALGCVLPWGYGILACVAYTALAAAVVRCVITRSIPRLVNPLVVALLIGLVLILLQYTAWPVEVVKGLNGNLAEFYLKTARFDPDPTYADSLTHLPFSLYRNATGNALLCYSIAVALYIATFAGIRSERDVSRCISLVVTGGFLASMVGILQRVSGTQEIYWMLPPENTSAFFGPYGSRNHFATYAGICLFSGVGLMLARHALVENASSKWRDNIRHDVVRKRHQNLLTAFLLAVTAAAIVFSLSRMGILSMVVGALTVLTLLAFTGRGKRAVVIGLGAATVVLGIVCFLGWAPIIQRLSETRKQIMVDRMADQRWTMFRDALVMGKEHLWTGTGAGTFRSAYPYYRTLPGDVVAYSPHNEYLHVFAELGLPGLILALGTLALVAGSVAYALKVRRNPYARGFLTGAVGLIVMVALHAGFDFPLRLPATVAVLAVVLGCVSRACVRRRGRTPGESGDDIFDESQRGGAPEAWGRAGDVRSLADIQRDIKTRKTRHRHENHRHIGVAATFFVCVIAVALWAVLCHMALSPVRAHMELAQLSQTMPVVKDQEDPPAFEDVMEFIRTSEQTIEADFPLNATLWAGLGEVAKAASLSLPGQVAKVALAEKAWELRAVACRLEPIQVRHRIRMAADFVRLGGVRLGVAHMQLACELRPGDPHVRLTCAKLLLDQALIAAAAYFIERAEELAETVAYREQTVEMGRLQAEMTAAKKQLAVARIRSTPPAPAQP